MYQHVLVPIDLTHGAVGERIIRVAKHLAGDAGRISLLAVLDPVPGYVASYIPRETIDETREDARAKLVALARATGTEAAIHLRTGAAGTQILEEAGELGCDAIVLGSHRPDYRDYLMGSTAARVVRHAQCTVVVERSEVNP